MPVEKQIAIIYLGAKGLLAGVPVEKVIEFEKMFLELLEMKHRTDVLDVLKTGVINDDVTAILDNEAKQLIEIEYAKR
jgi:F-type H+-transporting ATPase subunit alpha